MKQTEDFYKDYIDCLNNGDLSKLLNFFQESLKYNEKIISIHEYIEDRYKERRSIPDLFYNVELLVTNEDTIASRLNFNITPIGEFMGIKPNGNKAIFSENVFYRIRDGKIGEVSTYCFIFEDMFGVFEKYLREFAVISDEEMARIKQAAQIKNIRKWQSVLHDGKVWRSMCFIASGCCRLYRYDKNGTDHTVRFGVEHWWMTDPESYNHGTPSDYNIEALSASTVIVWNKEDWEKLMTAIPPFKLFYDRLNAKAFETSQQRIFSLISSPAEERYLEFQKTYPKVFNKVPLHMVASYLGISRETLSRIRKDFVKRTQNPAV